MNVNEMLDVIKAGIASIERGIERELSILEKREILVSAINRWNLTYPDQFIVIPPEYLGGDD